MVLRDEDPTAFRGLLEAAVAGDVMLATAPHWPLEVGNGLLGAVRRRRIALGDAERAYVRLLDLPIVVRPHVPFEDILARAATDELRGCESFRFLTPSRQYKDLRWLPCSGMPL
jgi:hypothetical protein